MQQKKNLYFFRVKCTHHTKFLYLVVVDSEDDFHDEDQSHKCKNALQRGGWSAATLKVLASMPSRAAGEESKRGNMSALN